MPFRVPAARFDRVHNAAETAPNGIIRVEIRCDDGDCDAGRFDVDVIESTSQEVIAGGAVLCTGSFERHDLQMTARRDLQQDRVTLAFTCGTEKEEGRSGRIWYRNE